MASLEQHLSYKGTITFCAERVYAKVSLPDTFLSYYAMVV